MDDKILKELREMNRTLSSIKTFIIADAQLDKRILAEIQTINRRLNGNNK